MSLRCKNHPDREAKRKCYYCKSPLCSDCQVTVAHHIYCSKQCYWKYLVSFSVSKMKQFFTLAINFLKKKNLLNFRTLFDIVLFFLIIVSIKLVLDAKHDLKSLQKQQQEISLETKTFSIDSLAQKIDTLTVFSPPPSIMVLKNRFSIEGETEENRIISLSCDGKLLEAKVAKGRSFSFDNVLAHPGQNHFIVRSMDEQGHHILMEEIKFFFGKPSLSYLARDFVRGSLNQSQIALTFDGGYLDNAASDILNILKQENIKATFFLTGIFLRKYPDVVKQMVAEGHEIGNHTWTHPHLTTFAQNHKHITLNNITPEFIQQELLRTAELFKLVTNKQMAPLWRAPYGEHNEEIRLWAAQAGFRHVGWTMGRNWEEGMDTMDWVADKNSSAYHSADEIADKILSFGSDSQFGANGTIILMHLGTLRTDDYPHDKLPMIIDQLKKRGYIFVKLSDML